MSAEEFVKSPKGYKRVMAIAKEINNNHRIAMNQCIEMAKQDVIKWFSCFSVEGWKA